ncbi:aspartate kinase [Candidatus Villigracilis saccharophilus]|uniref:aspartate kinase n=1 Tax=Candidatus Villigracilis saccharophilus TaxID=3140684 RepID=UPI003135887E|nr:aspartate kinase [Anaerolineales bacterium]
MQKQTLVMKFGGTSVGSADALVKAAQIVKDARAEYPRVVVITSAMSGVTNLLLDSAALASQGKVDSLPSAESTLREKHFAAADALIKNEHLREVTKAEINVLIFSLVDLCKAIAILGEASPRAMDAVASIGERMCVRLLGAVLEDAGINAKAIESTEFVVTNAHFQHAHPDFKATTEKTRQLLNPLMDAGVVPVTTGFIGATPEGVITTLGRGGSDYSAAVIGSVLPADDVWIWTDVDGVMTTDPRIVKDAVTLPEITYSEIAELAYYGAKVLHPKTIRPVVDAGIGLRICNTFNPSHPGTRLIANAPSDSKARNGQVVKAVTAIRNQRLVTIEGRGMLGVPGVAARAFGAVASTKTSVPLITQASSEQSICFAVPSESAASVLNALQAVFASEIEDEDIDRVWMTEDVSIITVVGVGMRHTPGVAGQVFTQLGNNKANVLAIAQGSSEVSISMVVAATDTELAVRSLHELIVK